MRAQLGSWEEVNVRVCGMNGKSEETSSTFARLNVRGKHIVRNNNLFTRFEGRQTLVRTWGAAESITQVTLKVRERKEYSMSFGRNHFFEGTFLRKLGGLMIYKYECSDTLCKLLLRLQRPGTPSFQHGNRNTPTTSLTSFPQPITQNGFSICSTKWFLMPH